MLPIVVLPDPGESLPGLLARSARYMGMSTRDLIGHLRLRSPARRPHNLYLPVAAPVRERLRHVLELDDRQLDALTLRGLPAFRSVPSAEPRNGAALELQRAYWWSFSADKFCPGCLREERRWLIEWQHPWAFCCVRHGQLLRQGCPSCHQPFRLIGASEQTTDERCSCGAPWSDAPADWAGSDAFAVQGELTTVVNNERAGIWGREMPGSQVLGAWRATATLLAGTAQIPRWAARPWLTPPDPATAGAVLTAALPVATAPSTAAAAEALRALFGGSDDVVTNAVRDRLPAPSPLSPVIDAWQVSRARVATRLHHTHRQGAFDLVDVGQWPLPTLAPLDVLPAAWRRPGSPHVLLRQCAVSLAAARLAGASTWQEAGDRIGVAGRYAPRITRHVVSKMGDGAASALSTAAIELARLARKRDFSASVACPALDSFAGLQSFAALLGAAPASAPYPLM